MFNRGFFGGFSLLVSNLTGPGISYSIQLLFNHTNIFCRFGYIAIGLPRCWMVHVCNGFIVHILSNIFVILGQQYVSSLWLASQHCPLCSCAKQWLLCQETNLFKYGNNIKLNVWYLWYYQRGEWNLLP